MEQRIITFHSGINNCYLLKDKGAVMVDAGWTGKGPAFKRFLESHRLDPGEIRMIILTHGDFDHAGGAGQMRALTGAEIAIHEMDRENLEKGIYHWPVGVTGWGKLSRAVFRPVFKKKAAFPATKADLVLDDKDLSLEEFGIRGKIVHTPGHTYGSVSVVLESGEALVGCLVHNRFPFVLRPRPPIYAMDMELLKKSLKKVIGMGVTTLYPAHGKPFPAQRILKYIS